MDTFMFRMDRTKIRTFELGEEPSDRPYWLSRPIEERFAAAEMLRQMAYGYTSTTNGLRRVLKVAELGES